MHTATRTLLRQWARAAEASACRRYITGNSVDDAIRQGRWLGRRGYSLTLGYWNDVGEPESDVYSAYQQILRRAAVLGPGTRIAIKPPAIRCGAEHLQQLLALGEERQVAIHLDSMRPGDADAIFGLLAHERSPAGGGLGCTLPARWQRSLNDADWVGERGLTVRVVKGQWPDPDADPDDVGRRFLDIVGRLAGRAEKVLVATHDIPLAVRALDRLLESGTACELEVLHGLPVRRLLPKVFQLRVPVRVYLPYGKAWLPYCIGKVRHDPRILLWLARDTLGQPWRSEFPPRPVA